MKPETERALAKTWAAWTAWTAPRGLSALPATVDSVVAYVDALTDLGRRPASIRQAVWGVAYKHRAAGLADPTKAEPVRLALKRMARTLGVRPRQAAPIGELEVQRILATTGSRLADLRNQALLLLMWEAMLGPSAALAVNVGDFRARPGGGGEVFLRDASPERPNRWVGCPLSKMTMTAVRAWLAASEISSGPLFRAVNKGGRIGELLTDGDVRRILKQVASRAGVEAGQISGLSCRNGAAQDLAATGNGPLILMDRGRWRSLSGPERHLQATDVL